MKNEEKFNKLFSAFVLIGMTVALVLTTALKLGDSTGGKILLLVSAFGSLMGVTSTVFSAKGNILTFLFGFLDVSIYGVICFINWRNGGTGLGNALLHLVYFVPMQFIGLAQWRKRGASSTDKPAAKRLDARGWLITSLLLLLGSVTLYFILAHFDKSAAGTFLKWSVILDVITLACNILGQLFMSNAYMEQWFFWIGVNIFSILMWSWTLSQTGGSYALIYIIKYSFYLINSIYGLRIWLALSRKEA
ncbi:MAG: nicotinamide riboside transporter PnuC [Bacteroidales bacterium]|nr:nicotinamide riboside transporter PnuC [Bacteroidales bacterium]